MKTCVNSACRQRLADDTEVCGNCGTRQPVRNAQSAASNPGGPSIRQVSAGENITQFQRITSGVKGLFVVVINVDRGAPSASLTQPAMEAASRGTVPPTLKWLSWLTIPAGLLSVATFALVEFDAELYRWSNTLALVVFVGLIPAFIGELNRPSTKMNGSVSVNTLLLFILWVVAFAGGWTIPGLRELTFATSLMLISLAAVARIQLLLPGKGLHKEKP